MSDRRARVAVVFSVAMVLIGMAMTIRTLAAGGGSLATGLVLGMLFMAAGAARLSVNPGARR